MIRDYKSEDFDLDDDVIIDLHGETLRSFMLNEDSSVSFDTLEVAAAAEKQKFDSCCGHENEKILSDSGTGKNSTNEGFYTISQASPWPCNCLCRSPSDSKDIGLETEVSAEDLAGRKKQQAITLLRVVFYFTLLFSFTEIFAGVLAHSLLLVQESVHMFADSLSYGVNLWAEIKSQSEDARSRQLAQLLGTFISLLALLGTLFAVVFESVRRLTTDERLVEVDANIMLGFGVALSMFHLSCLLAYYNGVNILHSHSHGGSHGHSHDHHQCSHNSESKLKHDEGTKSEFLGNLKSDDNDSTSPENKSHCHGHGHDNNHDHNKCHHHHKHSHCHSNSTEAGATLLEQPGVEEVKPCHEHESEHGNENLMSAIIHVFVDFLHSFIVIITALVVMFTSTEYSAKIDAASSLLICLIILSGCWVLFKSFWNQFVDYQDRGYHLTATYVDKL
mmetsp:Transcript_9715/g.11069  ORF Transcript_9715/g.11069 Transcript_9715/m.11069 type:complete len:447 (-) Transcript_9715:236-1576(-)|eukprot:CAMPEP_0184022846 /NCGR_PEP_ID=MMETSP0954-20121128/10913_1 /TAXON_ID=627963 /ORGANISM="Aplanochytrium sp, Strain PBS07" /LENGTH=446 /DNA_ID=CAMNT_0026305427 /DNA_START=263 /DNA_END=1603 /DNA_ORIENTATION=+